MTASESHWKRLGRLLQTRRVTLDPARFTRRRGWMKHIAQLDVGISERVIVDIETGARANYTIDTIGAVERAYRLRPGAIQAVLAGAEELAVPDDEGLRVIGEEDGVRTVQTTVRVDDEDRQVILPIDLHAIPGLERVGDEERERLIQQAIGAATHAATQFLEAQGRQRRATHNPNS